MLVAVFILVYLRRDEAQEAEKFSHVTKPETGSSFWWRSHTPTHLNQVSAANSEFNPESVWLQVHHTVSMHRASFWGANWTMRCFCPKHLVAAGWATKPLNLARNVKPSLIYRQVWSSTARWASSAFSALNSRCSLRGSCGDFKHFKGEFKVVSESTKLEIGQHEMHIFNNSMQTVMSLNGTQ